MNDASRIRSCRRLSGLILLLVAMLLAQGVNAAPLKFPALTGRVVDDAHVLSPGTIQQLSAELQSHEQATGEQLVVATLSSLQGQEIEEYGVALGRAWGIGQKGKNNGTLLLVAPAEHQTRIEVGYGMEGRLTDAATSVVINKVMLPAFRAGDYNKGVTGGAHAVLSILGGADAEELQTAQPAQVMDNSRPQGGKFPVGLIFLFLMLYFMFRSRGRRSLLGPMIIGSMLGGRGGGFGGGGFGGGGGFSGGGGSFGGGGSSGRW